MVRRQTFEVGDWIWERGSRRYLGRVIEKKSESDSRILVRWIDTLEKMPAFVPRDGEEDVDWHYYESYSDHIRAADPKEQDQAIWLTASLSR